MRRRRRRPGEIEQIAAPQAPQFAQCRVHSLGGPGTPQQPPVRATLPDPPFESWAKPREARSHSPTLMETLRAIKRRRSKA
eukprot:gene20006-biopygen19084